MKVRNGVKVLSAAGLLSFAASIASAEVVRHPLDYGMFLEYGQIFRSQLTPAASPEQVDEFTLKRSTGWFMQTATIDERLDLTMGMAAVLFYLYPLTNGERKEQPYNVALGGAALIQASGTYTWGDLKSPAAKLSFGYMPYKYNEDAQNFGEYLFRSTPYPSTVVNSSWDLENSAKARIWGGVLSKSAFDGKWKNDALLIMSDVNPLYDISPAYITSYKINPVVELGGGVNFFHLIQHKPSITALHDPANAYFSYNGKDYYAGAYYYKNLKTAQDSATGRLVDSLNTAVVKPSYSYYTAAGPMLMARISVNLKPVLGDKMDLKLYAEGSLLGVKNYPVFYEKIMDRTPLMLGANIPTFGMLDLLNVEAEYWKHRYLNVNTVVIDGFTGATPDYQVDKDPSRPDWKWSVTGKKSLNKALSITAKAATDHLTQLAIYDNLGSDVAGDILRHNGWYYVLRLDVAI